MEQKGIDEIEESFLAEEVVEEDSSMATTTKAKQPAKESKKAATSKTKTADKKVKIETAAPSKETKAAEKAISIDDIEDVPSKKSDAKETTKVKAPAAKVEQKSSEKKVDTRPWEDESEPLFSGGNAWAVLSGVLVILLLISVFTGGFDFTSGSSSDSIGMSEAEELALNYVNSELLPEPFMAEVTSSSDEGDVYSVTLSVGGQEVDSYVTKNGELFFPQGFDLTASAEEGQAIDVSLESAQEEQEASEEETVQAEQVEDETDSIEEDITSEPATEESSEEVVAEETSSEQEEVSQEVAAEETPVVSSGSSVLFNVVAKRWLFEPRQIVVNSGDSVTLNLMPEGISFSFAIEGHDAAVDVNGETSVSFVAGSAGEYEYYCSSCEDWRGMTGTLVVN